MQGITYIVSNSVEQLSSDNVAVMDDAGRVLSVPSAAGSVAGLTSRQLEFQRTTEGRLSEKIEALLGTVLGAGRARAQVAAQLSFDQVDETVETFDPDGQVLQTEQRSETGAGSDAAGTQTVVSNAYQNSRRTEKREAAVGTVTRLTIAVLVDEKALRATPSVRLDGIEGMVRDAIGADSTRGDRVSVMAVPFEQATVPVPTGGTSSKDKPKVDPVQIVERYGRPGGEPRRHRHPGPHRAPGHPHDGLPAGRRSGGGRADRGLRDPHAARADRQLPGGAAPQPHAGRIV